MMTISAPPVESVSAAAYRVPTDQPESDGTLSWDATTLVLVQVAAGGCRGLGYTYADEACAALISGLLAGVVTGESAMDVPGRWNDMVRAIRNLGRPGLASCAISAVDTALWDVKARILGVSLAELFGRVRDDVPSYGSGGFITYDEATARAQLRRWVEDWGCRQVKIKVGESFGRNVARDVRRVAFARHVIGDDVELFVDANGGYRRKQAVRVGRMFAESAVTWFEEPVSSDDLAGLREVRGLLDVDVAAGEYGYDLSYFQRMIAAEAVDCIQIDVTRCGGYTEWQRIAALAAANGFDVSAHCAPGLHLAVAAATQNLRHLEYFHDHVRLESMLFDGSPTPIAGTLRPDPEQAGHGLSLRESEAERFRTR